MKRIILTFLLGVFTVHPSHGQFSLPAIRIAGPGGSSMTARAISASQSGVSGTGHSFSDNFPRLRISGSGISVGIGKPNYGRYSRYSPYAASSEASSDVVRPPIRPFPPPMMRPPLPIMPFHPMHPFPPVPFGARPRFGPGPRRPFGPMPFRPPFGSMMPPFMPPRGPFNPVAAASMQMAMMMRMGIPPPPFSKRRAPLPTFGLIDPFDDFGIPLRDDDYDIVEGSSSNIESAQRKKKSKLKKQKKVDETVDEDSFEEIPLHSRYDDKEEKEPTSASTTDDYEEDDHDSNYRNTGRDTACVTFLKSKINITHSTPAGLRMKHQPMTAEQQMQMIRAMMGAMGASGREGGRRRRGSLPGRKGRNRQMMGLGGHGGGKKGQGKKKAPAKPSKKGPTPYKGKAQTYDQPKKGKKKASSPAYYGGDEEYSKEEYSKEEYPKEEKCVCPEYKPQEEYSPPSYQAPKKQSYGGDEYAPPQQAYPSSSYDDCKDDKPQPQKYEQQEYRQSQQQSYQQQQPYQQQQDYQQPAKCECKPDRYRRRAKREATEKSEEVKVSISSPSATTTDKVSLSATDSTKRLFIDQSPELEKRLIKIPHPRPLSLDDKGQVVGSITKAISEALSRNHEIYKAIKDARTARQVDELITIVDNPHLNVHKTVIHSEHTHHPVPLLGKKSPISPLVPLPLGLLF